MTPYKNDIIFLMRQALVRYYYAAEIYIIFLCILTTPNVKPQNYKDVDLIESYNFDVKMYLHLTPYIKDMIFLIRQALVRSYYAPEVYIIF